jgi:hypothetical protein
LLYLSKAASVGYARLRSSLHPLNRICNCDFFYGAAPLVLLMIFTLMISDWIVAGNAAQKMIRNRLSSTANVAAESLPYFLETGKI